MSITPRIHSRCAAAAGARGFTLIEVMVALFITTIGLLGIAKIEALVYANTGSASTRSLVAIQTAGLASAMHADRGYWAAGAAPPSFTITGTTISDATLNTTATGATDCNTGGAAPPPCAPATLAAFDLHTWATALNKVVPSAVTTVACPTGSIPVNCTISVTWNEKTVALNAQATAGTTAATFAPTYTLYVEP